MENKENQREILKKHNHRKITANIELLSGTRIGGSETLLEIGGVDSGLSCIKHPITYKPYLPGSSIKGKMRSEIEKQLGRFNIVFNERKRIEIYEPCGCAKRNCLVCRVFGPHKVINHNLGPSRILVRDSSVTKDGQFEIKTTTSINRKTNTAADGTLRTEERIVSGSEFNFQVDYQVWNIDKDCHFKSKRGEWEGERAIFEFIHECLILIEQTGIGAGTSKGSGQVKFKNLKLDDKDFVTLTDDDFINFRESEDNNSKS